MKKSQRFGLILMPMALFTMLLAGMSEKPEVGPPIAITLWMIGVPFFLVGD